MKKFEKGGMPEAATPIKSDFSQVLKTVSPRCLHYTVCEDDLKNLHARIISSKLAKEIQDMILT